MQAYQDTRDALQDNVIDPWKANPIGGAVGMATGLGPVTAGLMIKKKEEKQPTTQTAQAKQPSGDSMYIKPSRSKSRAY